MEQDGEEPAMAFDTPTIEARAELAYVAIPVTITMDGFGAINGLFDEVFSWLRHEGREPSGAAFVRLNRIVDMETELQIEVGVPVAEALSCEGRIVAGHIPAGSYVTLRFTAATEDEHIAANAHLQAWAASERLVWKNDQSQHPEAWGGRFEFSLTDPAAEGRQITELAYLIED